MTRPSRRRARLRSQPTRRAERSARWAGTPYELRAFEFAVDDGVFLGVGDLKTLRRAGLVQLDERRLAGWRRAQPAATPPPPARPAPTRRARRQSPALAPPPSRLAAPARPPSFCACAPAMNRSPGSTSPPSASTCGRATTSSSSPRPGRPPSAAAALAAGPLSRGTFDADRDLGVGRRRLSWHASTRATRRARLGRHGLPRVPLAGPDAGTAAGSVPTACELRRANPEISPPRRRRERRGAEPPRAGFARPTPARASRGRPGPAPRCRDAGLRPRAGAREPRYAGAGEGLVAAPAKGRAAVPAALTLTDARGYAFPVLWPPARRASSIARDQSLRASRRAPRGRCGRWVVVPADMSAASAAPLPGTASADSRPSTIASASPPAISTAGSPEPPSAGPRVALR